MNAMASRLKIAITLLTESFWFVPAVMALLSGLIAFITINIDHRLGDRWFAGISWVWSGSADGARSVLSVIAGSIMTVVSIVYSLTLSTLAQTSAHFGPRIQRNFTSDRGNQIVLGTFIATFTYSLLVLRTINSEDGSRFVPFLSVNIGVALALASLGVLIYFIHHLSQSIQVDNLIAEVGATFERVAENVHRSDRDGAGESNDPELPPEEAWRDATPVHAAAHGYIMDMDTDRLVRLACEHRLVIRAVRQPGDFTHSGSVIYQVLSAEPVSRPVIDRLLATCSWGTYRTAHQDILYPLQQLVEIACHALSPGINEPFTATTCIDWLAMCLCRVAAEEPLPRALVDNTGTTRVLLDPPSFRDMLDAAFGQIRLYGCENPLIQQHLLQALARMAPCLHRPSDRIAVLEYVNRVETDAERAIANPYDRDTVLNACATARSLLGAGSAGR